MFPSADMLMKSNSVIILICQEISGAGMCVIK